MSDRRQSASSRREGPDDGFPPGIANPARRALAAAGYERLDQLVGVREADLLALHGMGPKALGVLRQAMAERGMRFASAERAGS